MSTIKLGIEVSAENVAIVSQFLQAIAGGDKSKKLEVAQAEEVTDKPAPKPRPSRAKAKPAPVEEEEEFEAEEEEEFEAEEEADEISVEDVRAKQAEKIGKHKPAIIALLKGFGATGISSLDAKNYAAYFDALSKLK